MQQKNMMVQVGQLVEQLNTARDELAGNGTQTAGLALGGQTSPGNPTAVTEEYDGTSWANSNNLNVATKRMGAAGTQTAALAFGGANPAYTAATEAYDGTSWTVVWKFEYCKRSFLQVQELNLLL
jgi:hypothetical protein